MERNSNKSFRPLLLQLFGSVFPDTDEFQVAYLIDGLTDWLRKRINYLSDEQIIRNFFKIW